MVSSKHSPSNRRKSIAVINDQNKPAFIQRTKRRAHSVAPGELSPFAKARRLLVPRKSILKASINIQPQNGSQSSLPSSQSGSLADENATQSMDLTRDFTTNIRDNAPRKSLGRRVSFARTAKVRIFEKAGDNTASTNASDSPPSSPFPPQERPNNDLLATGEPPALSNENDYPGARPHRRSSARYSMAGSEDMDLTSIGPRVTDDSFNFEEDNFDFNTDDDTQFMDHDGDTMDVTHALDANLIRRRTLSIGGGSSLNRPPLAELAKSDHISATNENAEHSIVDVSDMSLDVSQDLSCESEDQNDTQSVPMEFTVPITQGLRPPAHQDPAWLALRAVTHSGDAPYDPPRSDDEGTGPLTLSSPNARHEDISGDEMELDDAMQRLMRARDSLPLAHSIPQQRPEDHDDSFSSSEGSILQGFHADETVNISKIIGRGSLGGFSARASLAFDSTMEGISMYGNTNATNGFLPVESTPTTKRTIPHTEANGQVRPEVTRPPVFQPPDAKTNLTASTTHPSATSSVFTPLLPASPTKTKAYPRTTSPSKPKSTFTAAFAPPSAKPSPKKSRPSTSASNSNLPRSSVKRPHLESQENGEGLSEGPSTQRLALDSNDKPEPRLSPTDRGDSSNQVTSSKPRLNSTIRRPSGYFSRRQSMGTGVLGSNASGPSQNTQDASHPGPLPKKPADGRLGKGRASVGSASSDTWTRFDRTAASPTSKGKEKEADIADYNYEPAEQAAAKAVSPPPVDPLSGMDTAYLATPDGFGENEGEDLMELDDGDGVEPETELDPAIEPGAKNASTEEWIEGVAQQESPPDDDIPTVSIAEFFQISGIKFMEELTAPRRSMSQPGRPERQTVDIPLSEFAIATAIDVPQLSLYTRVASDLEGWMKKSKVDMQATEEEATKAMPELFSEYLAADEEGKDQLRHHLNLIRTNVRELAKAEWYNWKLQWIEGLNEIASLRLGDLQSDADVLGGITRRADEILPSLQQEYAEVMAELEQEQAEVDDIMASDQEYLNELKASIAEQDVEVEALRAELAESNAQLARLQQRLAETEEESRQSEAAISSSKRLLHVQESSTLAEIMRLKDELEAMEDLHKFHATKIFHDIFEYTYASRYKIVIPCSNYTPIISHIVISKLDKAKLKFKDKYPHLSDYFLDTAKDRLLRTRQDWTVQRVVHCLSDYWSSCALVRSQIDLLSIKYPVTIEISSSPASSIGFTAKAQLMYPSQKAKAFVSFIFTPDTFATWPRSTAQLPCDVKVVYGSIQKQRIHEVVLNRLSEATPEDNHACLLDACIGAQDVYQ